MNKRVIPLLIISSFLLSGCDVIDSFIHYGEQDFVPEEKEDEEPNAPEEATFNISSAFFTDKDGHLRVNYTCNYESPFDVPGHEFSKLNITGVMATELDVSHQGYFTLLSPIVQTTLKFEFYDAQNQIYISLRYSNVALYDEDNPIPQVDFPEGYSTLYWSDEFNGSSLDTSKWNYEIGNGNWGWGNGEAQYYTNGNDSVSDGVLTIQGRKEHMGEQDYTSTRIKTQGKVKFTYGYVEARIALPVISGMWPAFWMMPNDSTYGGWPHSGEIDIMEARGRLPYVSSSAIHFSKPNGDHTYLTEEKSGHYIGDYHKYAVEWKEDVIKFFVDDVCYHTDYKNQWGTSTAQSSETAPFDQDFYIILNLAIGGQFDNWTMPPENFTSADMKIDYVRVFK